MDEMDDGLGNPRARPRDGLHFFRDFAMFCEDIRRASTPALHPRLFRPALQRLNLLKLLNLLNSLNLLNPLNLQNLLNLFV